MFFLLCCIRFLEQCLKPRQCCQGVEDRVSWLVVWRFLFKKLVLFPSALRSKVCTRRDGPKTAISTAWLLGFPSTNVGKTLTSVDRRRCARWEWPLICEKPTVQHHRKTVVSVSHCIWKYHGFRLCFGNLPTTNLGCMLRHSVKLLCGPPP